jgi:hypothetical protein
MAHNELEVFLAKLQSARFTAEPTMLNTNFGYVGSDAVFNPKFDFFDIDMTTGTFGQEAAVRGKGAVEQTFKMPVIPTTSSTEPACGAWLKCCGMEVTTATSLHTYAPSNTPSAWKDMTVWKYSGDKATGAALLTKASNCMYNVKITGKIGDPLMLEFTGKGVLTAAPAAASYVTGTLTIPAVAPAVIKTTTMTIAGTTLKCESFDLDAGNEVVLIVDGSLDYGYYSADIGKKAGKWSAKVFQESHATYNPFTNLLAGTLATMTCTFGVTNSKVTVNSTSKIQVREAVNSGEGGIAMYDLSGTIVDNDWSIAVNVT